MKIKKQYYFNFNLRNKIINKNWCEHPLLSLTTIFAILRNHFTKINHFLKISCRSWSTLKRYFNEKPVLKIWNRILYNFIYYY